MTVVSLAAEREARQPHWQGTVYCVGCQHEWEHSAPIGQSDGMVCPKCELPKGVCKFPFAPDLGDAVLTCRCGCQALFAYKHKARFYVRCMGCGNDLTAPFYGD